MSAHRPQIKFREKSGGRFLSGGMPWAYLDEIATDRRTKALAPGVIGVILDQERIPAATVAFNPNSKVALRFLDADPNMPIDEDWLTAKLRAAEALRARMVGGDCYRLAHAEGDGLPGVIIDRMGDVVVVQPNAAWADAKLGALVEAVEATVSPRVIVVNCDSRLRAAEGLDGGRHIVKGELSGPVEVRQNGVTYLADLLQGQKTGLYFDQRPNHAFVASLSEGRRVLDVFSHSGGFGLAALAAGASEAVSIDSSGPALALARAAAERSGLDARYRTVEADAFQAMFDLAEAGERFDVVVCDPPAFAPTKASVQNGLRAYERVARLAAPITAPGGFLTLCSCSHGVDPDSLREACWYGMRRAGRMGRLVASGRAGADHPIHPALPEVGYLKTLTFQLD